eukprot:TRINITY_DN4775_c0_g1_i1.p1 TRINITY_DN4775_c0_g1~~TRINITY_DN4775_c0_g1_i1.p1  ORF type:complete len:414 (+),score=81.03 TRINITY_DN4775_c0_g1_i1:61-1302(+)
MLKKLFRVGSEEESQKAAPKRETTIEEVIEVLNKHGITRLADIIKEKQISINHLLKQEFRSHLSAVLRLTMKERYILMDCIKDAGPKTNAWGYPTNFRERHRVTEEYRIFDMLESQSPEEVRQFKLKHFYETSRTLDTIPKWTDQVLPEPEYEDCIVYYDRWRDASRLPLSPDDLKVKATPNSEINNKVSILKGNICELEVDAVVNAANSSLRGGGGIDGAIHSAAGLLLDEDCAGLGGCETGFTKATLAYRMPCRYILHTVGPMREDPEALASCYTTILDLVKQMKIKSVALCCVSAGIFGFPLVHASHIAMRTVRHWMETEPYAKEVERIVFCLFLDHELQVYERLMPTYFPRTEVTATQEQAAPSVETSQQQDSQPAQPQQAPSQPSEQPAQPQPEPSQPSEDPVQPVAQ